MSSAYGKSDSIVKTECDIEIGEIVGKLKDGTNVKLTAVDRNNNDELDRLHAMLNAELLEGVKPTYPQRGQMDREQFQDYFLRAAVFVVRNDAKIVVGVFYVKPNYPGRCSHIANAGFIVHEQHRSNGVGRFMAERVESIASLLGYRALMYNLIFETNVASIQLWKSRGFEQIGRIPNAAQLDNGDFVDALQFYKDFRTN